MSTPLGVPLANIFVRHQETRLFKISNKQLFYKQYIGDTFVIFPSRSEQTIFPDSQPTPPSVDNHSRIWE